VTWRDRLRLAVRNSGVTQAEIARRAGLRVETVSRILTGTHAEPGFTTIIRLARAARVKVGWLLNEGRGVEFTDRERKTIIAAGVILLDVFQKERR
jgi:transcriptional regulator with XRE-family HTH domain